MDHINSNSTFNIVFMGTPEFAVPSLDILVKNNIKVSAVVTVPDKPAGRGLKIKTSAIKDYAVANNIPVLQPENLSSPDFINKLKTINPSLNVVVAFKILPREIFTLPAKGSVNLHASLLPQYRGAAPMNWAIINGEKYTGLTTFLLDENVDTGKILMSEQVEIGNEETLGELHDKMKIIGAELLLKTVNALKNNNIIANNQDNFIEKNIVLKKAPRIFRKDCKIDWNNNCITIFNKIRGLSPYPAAFTELTLDNGKNICLKIFKASYEIVSNKYIAGNIYTDNKSFLGVGTYDGIVFLKVVKPECKNNMCIEAFLRGNKLNNCF